MKKITSLIAGLLMTATVCTAQEKGSEPKTLKIDDNFYCIDDFSRQFFFIGTEKVLLEKNKKILIAGDSVQEGPIFMFGDVSKFDAYIASMEKLSKFKKNINTIYSAHNTLSYGSEYIKYCIEDAKLFKAGKIVPEETEAMGKKRKTYKGKHVSFFAD